MSDQGFLPKTYRNMIHFCNSLTIEDLAMLSKPLDSKPVYTHDHKGVKQKGGKPPIELSAVEAFVDLQTCIKEGDYEQGVGYYLFLKSLTHR